MKKTPPAKPDTNATKQAIPMDRMVKYPFPLRETVCCFFEVPRNLTKKEIERITHYLLTLTT